MIHSELLDNIYKQNLKDFKKSIEEKEKTFNIIKDFGYELNVIKYKNKMMKYLNDYNKTKFDNNYSKYRTNLYYIYNIELGKDIDDKEEILRNLLYLMDIVSNLNNILEKLINLTTKKTEDYNRTLYVYRLIKEESIRNLRNINCLYNSDLIKVISIFDYIRIKYKEFKEMECFGDEEIRKLVDNIVDLMEEFEDYKNPLLIITLKTKRRK